jgi:hypothetical protein
VHFPARLTPFLDCCADGRCGSGGGFGKLQLVFKYSEDHALQYSFRLMFLRGAPIE